MTTIEHALLGANLVLASGIDKKFGWQAVALAGFCAVAPDWDGLTILWSVPLFDAAKRRLIEKLGLVLENGRWFSKRVNTHPALVFTEHHVANHDVLAMLFSGEQTLSRQAQVFSGESRQVRTVQISLRKRKSRTW